MTKIRVLARGAVAWARVEGVITAGAVGIPVALELGEEWNGLRVVVKFRCGPRESQVEAAGAVSVPWDCLTEGYPLEVALDGWDGAGNLRIPTLWARCGTVRPSAAEGGDDPLPPALLTQELLGRMDAMEKKLDAAAPQPVNAPRVYCWGDSLTQGEGSNIKLTDGVFRAFNLHPYTAELTDFRAVNLGCQGEDVITIMARQGADPMVLGGFTIPADCTPVPVCTVSQGIPTASGAVARPLKPMEAGINPCTLSGVRGTLHRGTTRNDSDDNYYFTRLTPGSAVEVPAGSTLETFAMANYRNGLAVIWMGANGGHSGAADFCAKVKKMVAYGGYSDYLVLLSREFRDDAADSVAAALTDGEGKCHVLNLYRQLPLHGLTLANMSHSYFDTSGYAQGDAILEKAPILCACTMENGSPKFEALHFSAYGYRAIGKLVAAWLAQSTPAAGDTPARPPEESIYEENVTDAYGKMLWRLKKPLTSTGSRVVDTRWAPYDREKDWTLAVKIRDGMGGSENYNSILESRDDTAGVETTLHLRVEKVTETPVFNIGLGNRKGFSVLKSGGLFEWVGGDFSTDGYHYCILAKTGGSYVVLFDGGCWDGYGAPLEGAFTGDTLCLFARRMPDGSFAQYAAGTIEDFRIYDTGLTAQQCRALARQMQGVEA